MYKRPLYILHPWIRGSIWANGISKQYARFHVVVLRIASVTRRSRRYMLLVIPVRSLLGEADAHGLSISHCGTHKTLAGCYYDF